MRSLFFRDNSASSSAFVGPEGTGTAGRDEDDDEEERDEGTGTAGRDDDDDEEEQDEDIVAWRSIYTQKSFSYTLGRGTLDF